MKKTIFLSFLVLVAGCSSVKHPTVAERKPSDLIVGGWQQRDEVKLFIEEDYFSLQQMTFFSDHCTSSIWYKGNDDNISGRSAYHVFDEPTKGYKKPILLVRRICEDPELMMWFTIQYMDKDSMSLRFESDTTGTNSKIINFERISGPPENMPD